MVDINLEQYIFINQASFDIHTDIIFIKNTDLEYLYVNPKYIEISGVLEEDIINQRAGNFTSQETTERFHETDRQVINTGKPIIYEIQLDTPYRKNANYLITKAPIIGSEGDIIGISGSARSIEEYVDTRDELQTNLNLIEILLDTVPYPIFIKDTNGIYMKVNKAYGKDLGLTPDEIVGKTDIELFGETLGKFYQLKDEKVLESEKRDVYISTGIRKDIKYITTKDILRDSNNEIIGVVGIINTYQEISNINDEILHMEKIASISQLAGGIAHDLNNILANVTMLTGMLLAFEEDGQKISDLEAINGSINKASDLINKLKTFARKSNLERQSVPVNDLVQDVIQLVTPKYQKKYEIIENYEENDPVITGDKTQLSQMIMNLAINGFEAMNGGGTLFVRTFVKDLDGKNRDFVFQPDNFTGGSYVCIELEDTGSGIDQSVINQIFEPYYSSKGKEGTGLGLSIVYGVITSHEGILQLDTKPGEGTKFRVFLPMNK